MKAIIFKEYGGADLLHQEKIDKPIPKDDEVLIKVHAVSINSWDWEILQGKPFANRMMFGLFKPNVILGCDVAGVVEEVGKNVDMFKAGDEVFGDLSGCHWGGFSEYVSASQSALSIKPKFLSFKEASALPQAGLLALQALLYKRDVKENEKILINGASGGAGSFAVQIAKYYGAEVTGVCSGKKTNFVSSLGADHVIDYTKEDFTKNGCRYDRIVDIQGHHKLCEYKNSLTDDGIYAFVGGSNSLVLKAVLSGLILSLISGKKMGLVLHKPNKGLKQLIKLVESKKVRPCIDKCFTFDKTADAMRYYSEGHVKGKVVITLKDV